MAKLEVPQRSSPENASVDSTNPGFGDLSHRGLQHQLRAQAGPAPLVIHEIWKTKTRASAEMLLSSNRIHKRFATTVNAVPGSGSIKIDSELLMIVAVK